MDNERTQWAARMLTLPEPLQSRLMPTKQEQIVVPDNSALILVKAS